MKIIQQPLVSVIITAYNAEQYVAEAVESILHQTYTNIEILIVDDGSTDNTYNILKTYKYLDKRIKLFRLTKNSGPTIASNFLMKKAKGTFIARMDADDIAVEDRLQKQVRFLQENSDVIIAGGQCVLIDKNNNLIGEKKFPLTHTYIYEALFRYNPIQHPACMINATLLPKNIFTYKGKSILAHDLELLFILSQYGKLANLADTVLYYRQHTGSLSLQHPKKTFQQTLAVREKAVSKYGYIPTLKGKITHHLQKLLIMFLPERAIYPLFQIIRMRANPYARNRKTPVNYLLRMATISATLVFVYISAVLTI